MHIIIGAGIAGCYIAMQLKERNEPFVLLEASKEKPHTKLETNKQGLEMGASIFHRGQTNLMRLLRYLKLDLLIQPLPNADSTPRYVLRDTPAMPNEEIHETFERLEDMVRAASLNQGFRLDSVREVAKRTLTPQGYHLFKSCYDCWWEICDMNAFVFYTTPVENYLMLKGGLKNVIKTAWTLFEDELRLDCRVESVDKDSSGFYAVTTKNKETLRGENLYVCLSPEHLAKVQWNKFKPKIEELLSLMDVYSSIRYYVLLDEPVKTSSRYTVGHIIGHWWIQVAPDIFMLYTDGEAADALNQLDDSTISERFLKQLNAVYGTSVKTVKRTIRAYWPTAFEVLKPEYYTTELQLPFLVTSLPRPEGQAWMEGHLYRLNEK